MALCNIAAIYLWKPAFCDTLYRFCWGSARLCAKAHRAGSKVCRKAHFSLKGHCAVRKGAEF